MTLIPLFAIFSRMGWLNTYRPLIVPRWLGNPFYIFLLLQFYMSIPLELDDATRIDGGSYLTIYRSIVMPMAKPVLGVVAMFCITILDGVHERSSTPPTSSPSPWGSGSSSPAWASLASTG